MIRRDWPLAVFSVAVQFACGLALAAVVVEFRHVPAEIVGFRPLGLAIFPVLAAGLLCSLFHLGRPFQAWRSLTNVRQSRLSFEILATLIFAGAALPASAFWATGEDARVGLELLTALLGLAAVFVGAQVYMVPTQPVWNSAWLPVSFFATTLLLGGFASAVIVPWDVEVRRIFLGAGLGGGLVLLLALAFMAKRVPRPAAAPLFVAYVLLAGVLPATLVLFRPVGMLTPALIAAFGLIVLGALLGRIFLYALIESTPRF